MIVVYNICGIKKRENVNYYITAIEAILSQENVEFQLVVSGCQSSTLVKQILQEKFGKQVIFSFTEEILPVNITFNNAVRSYINRYGSSYGYIYMDSGIILPNRNILELVKNLHSDSIGMFSFETDEDNGELCNWKPNPYNQYNYFMPLGQTINLHFTFFPHIFYEIFGNILPDVFASYCTESIFVYLNSAIQKKWLVISDPKLKHAHGMDGGSSGFTPYNLIPHWHMFNNIRDMQACIFSKEAEDCGIGYEECLNIKKHNPEKFTQDGLAIDNNLLSFMKKTFFLSPEEFNYTNICSDFIDNTSK